MLDTAYTRLPVLTEAKMNFLQQRRSVYSFLAARIEIYAWNSILI